MRTENLVKVSFKDVLPSRKRVRYSAASLNFVEVDMHPLRLAKAMEDMSISDEEIIAEMDALTDKLLGDGKVPSLERHITFETLCMRLQKWRPSIIARAKAEIEEHVVHCPACQAMAARQMKKSM